MCDTISGEMRARLRNPKLTPAALATWRKRAGISQAKLAEHLGIRQHTWTAWERGTREPPFYLGFALNWLEHHELKGSSDPSGRSSALPRLSMVRSEAD